MKTTGPSGPVVFNLTQFFFKSKIRETGKRLDFAHRGHRTLRKIGRFYWREKIAGAVRKVCRCEPVTDVTGVAAPRLDGNSLVLRPRCLKIRGIVPEGNTLGVPHQRARWFAMTERFLTAPAGFETAYTRSITYLADSASSRNSQLGCSCRTDAGMSSVTGPRSIFSTISAL